MPYWRLRWQENLGRCKYFNRAGGPAQIMQKMALRVYFFLLFFWLGCAAIASAQKIKNDFFTLHNIIRGDSTYNTFDKQVELVKKAGFDGIEIN